MTQQNKAQQRFLRILRKHNQQIDQICRDWERSQGNVKKLDKPENCDTLIMIIETKKACSVISRVR